MATLFDNIMRRQGIFLSGLRNEARHAHTTDEITASPGAGIGLPNIETFAALHSDGFWLLTEDIEKCQLAIIRARFAVRVRESVKFDRLIQRVLMIRKFQQGALWPERLTILRYGAAT